MVLLFHSNNLLCVTHQGVDINVSQCSSINFTMAMKFDTGEIHKRVITKKIICMKISSGE